MTVARNIGFLVILFTTSGIIGQNKTIEITGIVKDSITKKPLTGVYITTGKQGAQTDYAGRYSIKNVTDSEVTLSTMYYSAYPIERKTILLRNDTVVDFILRETVLNLEEIVITGTRTEKRISEAPILTTVVREREIIKAGATSVLEALQDNIPGIVTTPNAMGNNLRIKGLNSRYILFLIDGDRMVSEGAGGNVDLNQIDVNNIKRIEVINGAASALYGSNAVGAVINIITKDPIHKFDGGADVQMESHQTLRTKLEASVNSGKFKTRVHGFRNSSSGFGGDGSGPYAAKYIDWGGNLKIGYHPSKQTDLNLTGRYFRHETFNPQGSLNTTHPLTHTFSTGVNGGYRSEDKRYSVRASVNFDKYFDTDYLEQLGSSKIRNSASYLLARILNTFNPTEKWEIIAGLEQNHEENYATKTLGSVPTTKKLDDFNIFGQTQWTPITNLDIIAGARYTYNTQFNSALTPKVSFMYKLFDFTFRGGVGTAFRAPSIKELYYDFDHQGMFWVYGNPNLKAEKGLYNSISAEYSQGGLNISLSGYWNDISNKITQYDVVTEQGKNEKYYKNVSSATLKGIDLNLSFILFKELLMKSSYSYCDAQDNSTNLELSGNVKHSGTVSITWNGKLARSPFSLQFAGRMNSPKLFEQMVTDNQGEQIPQLSRSKPYNIWKVVLVKPFRLHKHSLDLTFKCDNLFNFREATFVNPGRQYMIGLHYAFK